MRNLLFKILLFSLPGLWWPGHISAEVLRPAMTSRDLTTFGKLSNLPGAGQRVEAKRNIKWQKHKVKLHKLLFQKWEGKDGEKGLLILGVVILSFLSLFFALYGVVFIIIAAYLGEGFGVALLALVSFGISGLCIFGITRMVRNLKRLKEGYLPKVEKELPRRPPSRKMQ